MSLLPKAVTVQVPAPWRSFLHSLTVSYTFSAETETSFVLPDLSGCQGYSYKLEFTRLVLSWLYV